MSDILFGTRQPLIRWTKGVMHLMVSFVASDLRASADDGPTQSTFGWGGSVSGKVELPFLKKEDFLTFSITYGDGIGSKINDQPVPSSRQSFLTKTGIS